MNIFKCDCIGVQILKLILKKTIEMLCNIKILNLKFKTQFEIFCNREAAPGSSVINWLTVDTWSNSNIHYITFCFVFLVKPFRIIITYMVKLKLSSCQTPSLFLKILYHPHILSSFIIVAGYTSRFLPGGVEGERSHHQFEWIFGDSLKGRGVISDFFIPL